MALALSISSHNVGLYKHFGTLPSRMRAGAIRSWPILRGFKAVSPVHISGTVVSFEFGNEPVTNPRASILNRHRSHMYQSSYHHSLEY